MKRSIPMGLSLLFVVGLGASALAQDASPDPSSSPAVPSSAEEATMQITSTAFEDEGDIPQQFTCDGTNVSPALAIEEIPEDAVSLVLIVDDPDAPVGTWDHWIEYDIAPTAEIPEAVESLGTSGTNSWGDTGYGGPCPPSGTHRYFFVVYALDVELGWEPGADKLTVLEAIHDHVIAEASLLAFYSRE